MLDAPSIFVFLNNVIWPGPDFFLMTRFLTAVSFCRCARHGRLASGSSMLPDVDEGMFRQGCCSFGT